MGTLRMAMRIWLSMVVLGCGSEPSRGQGELGSGITQGGADEDEGDEDEDPIEDDEDDARLDVPDGVPPRDGCIAVDLLFVIDNSGSMCEAQEGLAAALPGLVDAIYDSLPADTDIHVGITTSSFSQGGSHQQRECVAAEAEGVILEHYVTDARIEGNGYQGRLYEYDGLSWFEANTGDPTQREPLRDWFSAAAASVGCNGGAFEFPSAAAAYAVDPSNADVNGGFLRDEGAALAIFVLTNEVDDAPEPAETYRDMIREAKAGCGGDACIVTAGLLATDCVPSSDPLIWRFLNAFGREPSWGDVLDFDGYGAVVSGALADAIVDTCESITPAG
jgi:hypothetical protein